MRIYSGTLKGINNYTCETTFRETNLFYVDLDGVKYRKRKGECVGKHDSLKLQLDIKSLKILEG